jgi:DNA-binding NtrC family response regulator
MHTNIKKILIVEDDFQLATEWQKELIDKGYICDIVTNSDDARLLFHKNYITVTGYYRDSDNHKISTGAITESLGADYTLKKPIEFSNVLKLIEDW